MADPYTDRCDRVQQRLYEQSADAVIAYPGPNLQYLTGFRGEPVDRFHVLFIPVEGETTLVTPESYLTQAQTNATADNFHTVPGNTLVTVADAIDSLLPDDPDSLLVDDNALHALTRHLYAAHGIDVVNSAVALFQSFRRRKDDEEVAALQRAANAADAVSEEIRALGVDAIGMTETDLATEIRTKLHAHGANGVAFEIVVGSGPNGADPALRFSDREIRDDEPVVIDFGCFIDGYASDQTRTVVFNGDPPAEFKRIHAAVLDALDAGVDAVEPGATAGDVDDAARETLVEYGYAEQFSHSTGHGVGLDAHEDLAITEDESTELKPGMVFSIEPGVYLTDEYGVRIEDLVVVTEDGCKRLNDSPRTWKP